MHTLPRRVASALLLTLTLGIGLGLVLASPARAADPKPAGSDPKALQLLDEVARSYQKLSSYSDQGEFALAATINGKSESLKNPMAISFVRPNKLKLDAGQVMVVSDGKTVNTVVVPLKKYTAAPAPETITFETFRQGPLGSVLMGGPSAPPMFILLNLLVGDDAGKMLAGMGKAVALEADRDAGGTRCKSLLIEAEQGPDFRLLVDPASKLLRSIDLVFDPQELAEKGLKDKVSIDRLGWSAGTIATKDPGADAFAFQAPAGFSKVDSLAQGGGAEDKYPVNDLVGKPAPDFTLTVLDGPGKTKTLSRKDLAGKVVMIDFWATWCGPCLAELPEVQKLVENYAKNKKNVLIIAVSQDDDPSELAEVRKLVEKTLDDKKIKLTGNSVGLIALDPSRSIGEAFQVNAYPTVVLLDSKGVVQGAHVGIPGGAVEQIGQILGKAIDTLLEGKPLAPHAEEAAEKPGK
jgi:thiol-disulfide isomerase/thioredoxin